MDAAAPDTIHSYGYACECGACSYLNRILPEYRPPEQGIDFNAVFLPTAVSRSSNEPDPAQRRLL